MILAVRNEAKGEAARARILAATPGADVTVSRVDMADLASIRAFAAREGERPAIDVLVNNAGLGMQPARATTADGFERQFATNHLGPFALTGLLLPALLPAKAPRVVAVASIVHRRGKIDFADLQGTARYSGGTAYNQSKLANILFALELDRRARAAGSHLVSAVAHPGISATGFIDATQMGAVQTRVANVLIGLVGQDAAAGAAPLVYAATMPDVVGGQYWGPDGLLEFRGRPAPAKTRAAGPRHGRGCASVGGIAAADGRQLRRAGGRGGGVTRHSHVLNAPPPVPPSAAAGAAAAPRRG